jgi:hypothetical protein
MAQFDYECSKLKCCKILTPIVSASVKQIMGRELIYFTDTQELVSYHGADAVLGKLPELPKAIR